MESHLEDELDPDSRSNCIKCQEGFLFAEKRRLEDGRIVLLEQCTKCDYKEEITRALIIREIPLNKILQGIKLWEMRERSCRIRGRIGLIRSSSGKVIGAADVVGSKGPLTDEELRANTDKHESSVETLIIHGYRYAWVLKNARRFAEPIPYKHPRGAVIWVDLTKEGVL